MEFDIELASYTDIGKIREKNEASSSRRSFALARLPTAWAGITQGK